METRRLQFSWRFRYANSHPEGAIVEGFGRGRRRRRRRGRGRGRHDECRKLNNFLGVCRSQVPYFGGRLLACVPVGGTSTKNNSSRPDLAKLDLSTARGRVLILPEFRRA